MVWEFPLGIFWDGQFSERNVRFQQGFCLDSFPTKNVDKVSPKPLFNWSFWIDFEFPSMSNNKHTTCSQKSAQFDLFEKYVSSQPPPQKKKHETHSLASYWPSIVGDRHVVRKHNVGLSSFSHLFVASRPCFGNIVHIVGADCWHHVGHGHGGSPKFPRRAKSGELYCTCSLRQTGKQKRTKLQNEVKANIFFVHPTQTERNSHQQDFCWFFSDWGSRPYISYNKHAFVTVTGLGGYQSMQIQLIPLKWS